MAHNYSNDISLAGRLHSVATEGIITGADEVFDDSLNKKQSVINSEVKGDLDGSGLNPGLKNRMTGVETRVTAIEGEIEGGIHFIGKLNTSSGKSEHLVDNAHTSPIYIVGVEGAVTPEAGDIVLDGNSEFIWDGIAGGSGASAYTGTWHWLGNQDNLGDFAYADTGSGTVGTSNHTHNVDVWLPSTISDGDAEVDVTLNTENVSTKVTATGTITSNASSGDVTVATGGSNDSSTVSNFTGGESKKLVTTTIPAPAGPTTLHDTPTLNAGTTPPTLEVGTGDDAETLIIGIGTAPSLTAGTAKSVYSVGNGNLTVATGQVAATSETSNVGAVIVTQSPTGATAAAQTFIPSTTKLSFSGTEATGTSTKAFATSVATHTIVGRTTTITSTSDGGESIGITVTPNPVV